MLQKLKQKPLFIVILSLILTTLAGAGIGGYVYTKSIKTDQKPTSVAPEKPKDSKFAKYAQSGLASRGITEYAQDLVRDKKPTPPEAARLYAFVSTAFNDIYGVNQNKDAALNATSQVLAQVYPDKKDDVNGLVDYFATGSNVTLDSKEQMALDAILKRELGDGFRTIKWDGVIPASTGKWTKTALDPFAPTAGQWQRWLVDPSYDYSVPAPILPGSPEYETQKKAVQDAVSKRGPNDINDINFWGGGPGSESPSGIWQTRLYNETKDKKLSEAEYANSQKVLAQALADSFMETWKIKYQYFTERPSMIIKDLALAMPNPNFPGYVSGHSTVSRTAAEVLGNLYPEKSNVWSKDAETAKNSRLSAGVHFPMDNDQGVILGEKIGKQVLAKLGKISQADANLDKIGGGKMTAFVTDKSHDYGVENLKDKTGYLYRVTDTNPKPVPPTLLASVGGDKLNGKDGFQFEQIGADPFWLPGACASLPSYKVDSKNLLTLVGRVDINGNKTADKYAFYNYDTRKFTYVYDEKDVSLYLKDNQVIQDLKIGGYEVTSNQLSYYYIPSDKVIGFAGGYRVSNVYNTDYMIRRVIDLKDYTYNDFKVKIPNEMANRPLGYNIIKKSLTAANVINSGNSQEYGNESTSVDLQIASIEGGYTLGKVKSISDAEINKLYYLDTAYSRYDAVPDYNTNQIIITDSKNNPFTDLTVKKGLENAIIIGEDNNYLSIGVGATQGIGSANVIYIDKATKDVRILVNQEYTLNPSTGGNEAKYPVFSLGNLNP